MDTKIYKKPIYKNSIKTRQSIKFAFLNLLKSKDISQIRVKQILELADISKGTFYAHYHDVYNILEEIENENIERMTIFLSEIKTENLIDDFMPLINKIFKQIHNDEEFFRILFNSTKASSFLEKLEKVFINYMMKDKQLLSKMSNKEDALLYFKFISSGTVTILKDWFTSDFNCSFEELANKLNQFIIKGIDAIK